MKFLRSVELLLGKYKKYLGWIFCFIVAMEVLRVLTNALFAGMITSLAGQTELSLLVLGGWFALSLISWLFDGINDYTILKLLISVEYSVPLKALRHLVLLSMRFFANCGTGKIAKRIEKGADGLGRLLEAFSWEVVSSVIQFVITTTYLTLIFGWWGLILIVMAPIFLGLTLWLDHFKKALRKERHDLYETSGHLLFQIMQNIGLIKAFAQEDTEVSRYEVVRRKIYDVSIKEFRYEIIFNVLRGILISVTLGAILYMGSIGIAADQIQVGDVAAAMGLATAASFSLFRFTRIFVRFMDHYEAIQRVVAFLEEQPDIVDDEGTIEVSDLSGDVVFENVCFSYNGGEGDCLEDISFTVPAGKMVAVVGPSGSGKTTLIHLLMRFMDPRTGVIKVGGYDLRTISQCSYRGHLSVVLQDTLLFDRTLGANVVEGLGVDDYASVEDDVWDALMRSHAVDFVRELPGGDELATLIGERGVKLSGGQRQRVAIAMALIRKPVILILDEATSSLDTQSERAIQEAMRDLQREGKTTIFVIAHRLSTVRHADTILVLDKGKLIQSGSHEELMQEESGLYAQMVGAQTM